MTPTAALRARSHGRLLADVDDWCEGRWWHARIPLLVLFAHAWALRLEDPLHGSIFRGLNLGIHELGHLVFAPFGDIPSVLGGSILQCLVPVIGMILFLGQRDYFAITVAFGWLGINCFEVATYAGDAVRMALPLVSPGGGEPIHDWNYVLGYFGWLRHADAVADAWAAAGHACMGICLAGGVWLVGKMFRSAQRRYCAR